MQNAIGTQSVYSPGDSDPAEMPADCLTKWLPSAKLKRSVEYMTGVRARPTEASHAVIGIESLDEAIANFFGREG